MKKPDTKYSSLNFKNPEKSDRFNPFTWIQTESDMLRIIKSWHDAVRPIEGNTAADPFWDDAVDLKMQSVFYYAWLDAKDHGRTATFNDVMSLLALENEVVNDEMTGEETNRLSLLMRAKEREKGADYPPVRAYRKFQGKAAETEGSVSLMISAMLISVRQQRLNVSFPAMILISVRLDWEQTMIKNSGSTVSCHAG